MVNSNIGIELEYCKHGEVSKRINIEPSFYFDDLEAGDLFEYDSPPKYLEQYQYSGEQFEKLSWTKLTIYDYVNLISMISEEKYWGQGNCHRILIVSIYQNGNKTNWEGTIEITCQKTKELHIIKLTEPTAEKASGLLSHTILTGSDDAEEIMCVNIN